MARHFSTEEVTKYLVPNPRLTGKQAELAEIVHTTSIQVLQLVEDSPELTVGLRKLLEAKDAFVRASLDL